MKHLFFILLTGLFTLNINAQELSKDKDFKRFVDVTKTMVETTVSNLDDMTLKEIESFNKEMAALERQGKVDEATLATKAGVSRSTVNEFYELAEVLGKRYADVRISEAALKEAVVATGIEILINDPRTVPFDNQGDIVASSSDPCFDAYRTCRGRAGERFGSQAFWGALSGGIGGGFAAAGTGPGAAAGAAVGAAAAYIVAISAYSDALAGCRHTLIDCLN